MLGGLLAAPCLLSVRGLPYLMLGPAAAALALESLWRAKKKGRLPRALLGTAIGGALALGLSAPFTISYLTTWGHRIGWQTFGQYPQGETQGAGAPFFYLIGFFTHGAGPVLGALTAVGMLAAIAFRRCSPLWIWVWALLPTIALSTFGTKMVVYMVVAMPAFAALGAIGIDYIPRSSLRKAALVCACAALLIGWSWQNFVGPGLQSPDPDKGLDGFKRNPNLYEIANYAIAGDPTPGRQMLSLLHHIEPAAFVLLAGSGDDVGFGGMAVELQYAYPAIPLVILYPSTGLYPEGLGEMWVVRKQDIASDPGARDLMQLGRCLDHLKIRTYQVQEVDMILHHLRRLNTVDIDTIELGPVKFPMPVMSLEDGAGPDHPGGMAQGIWPMQKTAICVAGKAVVER